MTTTLPPEYDLERFESVVSNLPVLTYTADLTERFVSRCLSQIVLAAESYAASGGVVPEVDAQTLVEGEVALVQREFRLLQQTNAELCAILTGVFQVAQALTRHAGATPDWKRRRADAADGLAVYPPSPSIVAMVQQQRRLPEHFQRANLSIAENNAPVYAARLRELLHGRQETRARRMLNVYADSVWRAVSLRQSLEL